MEYIIYFHTIAVRAIITVVMLGLLSGMTYAADHKVLTLYHDADWSNHVESAESIWRGVQTALSEIDYTIQGYRIKLVKKDHHGSVIRSLINNEEFLKDQHALAIISGIHSPPLIKNRAFINQNKVLTLVPWAAGGPITRYPSAENWVFRLSVDDTKAGDILVNHAVNVKGCKAPHLLLEDTPWGDSNFKNMKVALQKYNNITPRVTRFNWNIKGYTARSKLITIQAADADCVLLVANAIEGAEIVDAMADLDADKRLPIISHWGITGGNFHDRVNAQKRQKIDLSFIQSCFSFMRSPLSSKGEDVFNKAKQLFPEEINTPEDIRSPVGFIHGYDITMLLISALNKIEITSDILVNRNNVRLALENLNAVVEGLIKTYRKPFSVFSDANFDAHEALNENDYCMSYYDQEDNIITNHH